MPGLVYISRGALHLLDAEGRERRVESQFGRSLRDRAAQIENRHAWKSQGRGARFMSGMLWGNSAGPDSENEIPIRITGVTRDGSQGGLCYSLETDEVAGVFAVDGQGVEDRLFHTADFRLRHLTASPSGEELAATVAHASFTTNIGVLGRRGGGLNEVTEGDSLDCAPRWRPGPGRNIVYQSAGIGRDAHGRLAGFSPFGLYEVDLDSGDIRTLAEDERHDLMMPLPREDGSLLHIRRPRTAAGRGSTALAALKETLLFPFRMSFAVFQFFNFFSMRYGGKPLVNHRGGVTKHLDPLQLLLAGNLAAAASGGEGDAPEALVPDNWELVERQPNGSSRVLAQGVLSFDASPQGDVLYSNGAGVFRLRPNGEREKVTTGKWIEQVALL